MYVLSDSSICTFTHSSALLPAGNTGREIHSHSLVMNPGSSSSSSITLYSPTTADLRSKIILAVPNVILGVLPEIGETGAEKTGDTKECCGGGRLRWNLVFNLLVWLVVPLPLWLPMAAPRAAFLIALPGLQAIFQTFWLAVAVLAVRTVCILCRNR